MKTENEIIHINMDEFKKDVNLIMSAKSEDWTEEELEKFITLIQLFQWRTNNPIFDSMSSKYIKILNKR